MNVIPKSVWLVAVLAIVAVSAVPGQEQPLKSRGVFSKLRVGQSVNLKDEGAVFSISYFDEELPQAHQIIEVGEDYIVLRDIAGVTETTLPVYALKSIEKVRTKIP